MHTYSPVLIPLSWKSELIKENSERVNLVKPILENLHGIAFYEVNWPFGYGTLEHDNLPLFFQPAGVVKLLAMCEEEGVLSAELYLYDNCLAVLHVELSETHDPTDGEVTTRVNHLSQYYLTPVFKALYSINPSKNSKIISPLSYKIFNESEATLCCAFPLWVARTKVRTSEDCPAINENWLQNIDSKSDLLLLGSGNSLLCDDKFFIDFHRVMLLAQFHAALMSRIESRLKDALIEFNQFHYNNINKTDLGKKMKFHQSRNDHIEFINIQFSAAPAGVQGKRRMLLGQFSKAWAHEAQRLRIERLTQLVQNHLSRYADQKLAEQNRGIQTVLAFLAALSMLSLVSDLNSLDSSLKHEQSYGLLDLFHIVDVENVLNIITLAIIFVTIYFYRNHE